ncbi:cation:proton antiporter [Acidobacteriota bacterium]
MNIKRSILICVYFFFALGTVFASTATTSQDMGHMMTTLVMQLAVIVIAARSLGFLFPKFLKQPRVLGELIAGMIIGPYALGAITLPLVNQPLFPKLETVIPVSPELYGIAVVASIVLLFLAGLETDLPTFLKFSHIGTLVGLGGVIVSFFLGDMVAVLLLPGVDSFMHPTALFLGTLSTATSVGITARILSEKRKLSSPEGVTILAGAVLDDVIGIVILAVVVGIIKISQSGGHVNWGQIGFIALKAFGFWLVLTVLGILFAKKISRTLKWLRSKDAMAGMALGLALFFSGLAEIAGLAMIIGAYVVGLSLSQTDMANELRERLHGVYQFLVPVFFCVMGMMVNFVALKGILFFGLIYAASAIVGKLVGCGIPAYLAGFNLKGAFRIGAGMLPRGEVTLIIAGIGLSTGAIGQDMFGVAIMTLLIASVIAPPLLIKSFDGGNGLRNQKLVREDEAGCRLQLKFPSIHITDFIRTRILQAFQTEEFFVHRLNLNSYIYHIKKEDIFITLIQNNRGIELSTESENKALASLIVAEEILELKDLLEGVKELDSPDGICEELVSGLFSDKE